MTTAEIFKGGTATIFEDRDPHTGTTTVELGMYGYAYTPDAGAITITRDHDDRQDLIVLTVDELERIVTAARKARRELTAHRIA